MVKWTLKLLQKGSAIIVSDGKEDLDRLMTRDNFPDAEMFTFTEKAVKTSS